MRVFIKLSKTFRTIHLCVVRNLGAITHLLIGKQNESIPHSSRDRLIQQKGNIWLVYFTGQQENKLLAISTFFKFIPLGLDSNVYSIHEEYEGQFFNALYNELQKAMKVFEIEQNMTEVTLFNFVQYIQVMDLSYFMMCTKFKKNRMMQRL